MRIGVLISSNRKVDIRKQFSNLQKNGFTSCQLLLWPHYDDLTDERAVEIRNAAAEFGVEITHFWCGWPGYHKWDNYSGYINLGIVPPSTRALRVATLIRGSDFAKILGVKNMITHAGFIPESPLDPNYLPVIEVLVTIVKKCRENGQCFLFETGQETPITLRRAIADVEVFAGKGNVGVNLDPANLLCYGKGNPVDALEVLGDYIMGIHAKDALVCTDFRGSTDFEVPIGQGKVNFPVFLPKLKALGYDGEITIEREITGEQQLKDILAGRKIIEEIWGNC